MDPWLTLAFAGLFEVGFHHLPQARGAQQGFIHAVSDLRRHQLHASFPSAAEHSPVAGTAYAVWTGIGAIGTVLVGALAFGERLKPATLGLLGVVLLAIVGLKVLA